MAILASECVKELRKERNVQDEIEFYGVPQRATDFEKGNIESFFEQELEEIVKVPLVWAWLQKQVKDDLDGVWLDPKTLLSRLNNRGYVTSEKRLDEMLESLCDELTGLYQKQLNEGWHHVSVEQAEKVLPKGVVHIALLDKEGKITREPYPITMNMKAKVSWKIEEEDKRRYIHVTVDPPIKTKSEEHKGQAIRLNENEVKAEVIRSP